MRQGQRAPGRHLRRKRSRRAGGAGCRVLPGPPPPTAGQPPAPQPPPVLPTDSPLSALLQLPLSTYLRQVVVEQRGKQLRLHRGLGRGVALCRWGNRGGGRQRAGWRSGVRQQGSAAGGVGSLGAGECWQPAKAWCLSACSSSAARHVLPHNRSAWRTAKGRGLPGLAISQSHLHEHTTCMLH